MRLPWWTVVLLLAAAGLAAYAGYRQPWLLRQGELLLYDVNAQSVSRSPAPRMALVVIGERSLATIGAWPFPRGLHAQLLEGLAQARVVGLDLLFAEPSPWASDDAALARAIAAHGRVVLAAHTAPLTDAKDAGQFAVQPTAQLYEAAADIGFTNVDKDVDGLLRYARPVRTGGGEMLPSLALSLARQALEDEGSLEIGGGGYRLRFREHTVQMDEDARLWFVPTAQGPPVFEYVDVVQGRVPPEVFKGAIVLVGAAASGAADFQIVPQAFGSRVISGVRFNAEELRALLSGDAVRVQPPMANALIAGLLALCCGLAMLLLRPVHGGLVLLGVSLSWLGVEWYLLSRHLVWLAGLTPVVGAAGASALLLLARMVALHESWRAQHISLDSIVYLDEEEAGRHPSLEAYLGSLWARVQKETGVRFLGGPVALEDLPGEFRGAATGGDGVLILGRAGQGGARGAGLVGEPRRMAVPLKFGAGTRYALFGLGRGVGDDGARAAAALAISAGWFFRVQKEGERRRKILTDTIKAVFTALDFRDPITGGHSTRVSELCLRIMNGLNLPQQLYEDIHLGALIHDLGKIGIPDSILNKRDTLTEDEYRIIRNHPNIARSILSNVELPQAALEAVYHHHERFDGSGYPQGLRGDEISLAGRIVAIADVFDAMTHNRPYREGQTLDEVLGMMTISAGRHFDPELMRVFLELFEERAGHLTEKLGKSGTVGVPTGGEADPSKEEEPL